MTENVNARIAHFIDFELASNTKTESQLRNYYISDKEHRDYFWETFGSVKKKNKFIHRVAVINTNDFFGHLYGWTSKINHGKYSSVTFAFPELVNDDVAAQKYPVRVVMAAKDMEPGEELLISYGEIQFYDYSMFTDMVKELNVLSKHFGETNEVVMQTRQQIKDRFAEEQVDTCEIQQKSYRATAEKCNVPFKGNFLSDAEIVNIRNIMHQIINGGDQDLAQIADIKNDYNIPALHDHLRKQCMLSNKSAVGLAKYFNVGSNAMNVEKLLENNGIGKFYFAAIGDALCEPWMKKIDSKFCEWSDNYYFAKKQMEKGESMADSTRAIELMSRAISRIPYVTSFRLKRAAKYKQLQLNELAMNDELHVKFSRFA